MSATVKISGLRELEKALAQLPKATGRAVLKRVLVKAGKPIADMASSLAPRDTGELAGSIKVSAKIKNNTGKSEYAAVMKAGGSKDQAVAALRSARRSAGGAGSSAEVYVGPTQAKSKKDAIKRIVQEFGSEKQGPQPYMRPAWDAQKGRALEIVKNELGGEIAKSAARVAKRAAMKK